MTAHLTDRRRIEVALPAVLLQRVARVMLEQAKKIEHAECLERLDRACEEPFADLPRVRANKLRRRVMTLQAELFREYEERPVITVFLMVVIWLRDMLADGTLVLIEASDFDLADRPNREIQRFGRGGL